MQQPTFSVDKQVGQVSTAIDLIGLAPTFGFRIQGVVNPDMGVTWASIPGDKSTPVYDSTLDGS